MRIIKKVIIIVIVLLITFQILSEYTEKYQIKPRIGEVWNSISDGNFEKLDTLISPDSKFIYGNTISNYANTKENLKEILKKTNNAFPKGAYHIYGDEIEGENYIMQEFLCWPQINGGTELHIEAKFNSRWNGELIELKSEDILFEYLFINHNISLENRVLVAREKCTKVQNKFAWNIIMNKKFYLCSRGLMVQDSKYLLNNIIPN